MSQIDQELPSLLTPDEIARELKVPLQTIYYWTSRSEIPFIKMGRHLRFDRSEVISHFRKKMALPGRRPVVAK